MAGHMRCIVYDNLRAYIFQTRNCIRIRKIRLQNMNPFIRILTAVLLNIDAENLIATSGPADKTVPANDGGNAKDSDDDDDEETYLDESDGIGNIDDGMSVRDIDVDGQISEEESDYDNYDDTNDNEEEEA